MRDQVLRGLAAGVPFGLLLRCSFFGHERSDELAREVAREVALRGLLRGSKAAAKLGAQMVLPIPIVPAGVPSSSSRIAADIMT